MPKQYLETGRIVGTHGIKGELRMQPWSDSPDFLREFKRLYLDAGGEKFLDVETAKPHKNIVILKISGVDNIDTAERLRGKILYIDREDISLPDDSWFVQDLIGCEVLDHQSGNSLGRLSDVSKTGANDVWHIEKQGREYLIPAIPDVVIETDIPNKTIRITPLRGIFEDED